MNCSLVRAFTSFVSVAFLGGCGVSSTPASSLATPVEYNPLVDTVPKAVCGVGSLPESDLQGRVSAEDRASGRSQLGYRCNLEEVGHYQGEGTSWVSQSHATCAYLSTHYPGSATSPGVQVIDVADVKMPRRSTNLSTPGMLGTWESLKVNPVRNLLAGTFASSPGGNGPLYFDLYDIAVDCARPVLKASLPLEIVGHEGAWAPDGNTYYASSTLAQRILAIDTSDPTAPSTIVDLAMASHGLSLSQDGTRAYMTSASCGNGLKIVDVSEIQKRLPNPAVKVLGEVCWDDGSAAQATIPISIRGKPYVIFFDEGGDGATGAADFGDPAGAARIIDISDETKPVVVSKLKLEIHLPENASLASGDVANTGIFGYQAHYCAVDERIDPTALACAFFNSGIRVFDIRDPIRPREIAYFNPPAQAGKQAQLLGSEHAANVLANSKGGDLTADWCSSPPRFVKERGELWAACQDYGFMVLKFTNGAWPFKD